MKSWQASRVPLVSPAALAAIFEHQATVSGHCGGSCKWRQGLTWHVRASPGELAFSADRSLTPLYSVLLMNAGCTDAPLRGWMHIWNCQSNMEGDTITCFCNYGGFCLQEANNSLTRLLQVERVCCQTSPELLFPKSWTKATEAMGSACMSAWEKGRPPFTFWAPKSHLLHGGKNYAVGLRVSSSTEHLLCT